jgi:hypothetical protein
LIKKEAGHRPKQREVDWLPLALPLWVLVLSLYILVENLRPTKPGVAA